MISREELARIKKMADDYIKPPQPRAGHQTIALYDQLNEAVMANLPGLLEAAEVTVGEKSHGKSHDSLTAAEKNKPERA